MEQYNYQLEKLKSACSNYTFIRVDRWAGAGRNVYLGSPFLDFIKPDITISTSVPWGNCGGKVVFCAEVEKKERTERVDDWIYETWPKVKDFIHKRPALILFMPTERFDDLIEDYSGIRLTPQIGVAKRCESKQNFASIIKKSGVILDNIPRILSLDDLDFSYESLSKYFNGSFVLQAESKGGRGTYLIKNQTDYTETLKKHSAFVKASEYVSGDVYNFGILTIPTEDGKCSIYVDAPSFKPMNIRELMGGRFVGVGNEWGKPIEYSLISSIISDISKIGEYLFQAEGLVGLWGVDVFITEKGYKFIEINARIQGTTEVSSAMAINRGIVPHIVSHIAIYLGIQVDWLPESQSFNKSTALSVSSTEQFGAYYIKLKEPKSIVFTPSKNFKGSGKYKICQSCLQFVDDAASIFEADLCENTLLITNTPPIGTKVDSGLEIAMIEGIKRNNSIYIFTSDSELSVKGKEIVRLSKQLLGLS